MFYVITVKNVLFYTNKLDSHMYGTAKHYFNVFICMYYIPLHVAVILTCISLFNPVILEKQFM